MQDSAKKIRRKTSLRAAKKRARRKSGDRNKGKGGPATPAKLQVLEPPPRPTAPPARVRRRHYGLLLSFVLLVLLPVGLAGWYLYDRAADQYASSIGFSVRTEEVGSAFEILGGITELSSGSSKDTDILYEFIQSQEIVGLIDAKLDLKSLYSKPANDPVFSFDPTGSIEDLVSYWNRMVKIYYDGANGLIEVRVQAFAAEDARKIAEAILSESTLMINRLSAIARADATRYARDELEQGVERLKRARQALTQFRSRTQIVDPAADIQGQVGLLNTLQQQLAETLIDLDILRETTRDGDSRITQAERRVAVIEARIAEERKKFGIGGKGRGGEAYATLIGEYEGLIVDREFAERTYLSALTAFDTAIAEAQRQSRYLATYIKPTLAESAQYPQKEILLGIVTLFLLLTWSIAALIYYSVKDRR